MPNISQGPDPTIHRRRLRSELRNAREACDKTQREVAAAMDWSASKLIRIETGAVNISTNDLRALLNHYELDQERIENLVSTARASREPPRWNLYKDVATPEYISFLGCESSASVIRNFEPLLVPGLLQTEEYARNVITAFDGAQRTDALVDLRTQRQEVLTRENPPDTHFILDEAVISRIVGNPAVMRQQIRHLQESAEQPNITIRIMSFKLGMYPRLRVPYVIFEFPEPEDEDVMYIENPTGELFIRENSPEERSEMTPVNYLGVFWQLEQITSSDETPAFLARMQEGLRDL